MHLFNVGFDGLGCHLLGKNCSLCRMFIRNFSNFSFGFEDMVWVLIASVPGHCSLVTFKERENVIAIVNVFVLPIFCHIGSGMPYLRIFVENVFAILGVLTIKEM